jgi:hypothetical protein
LIPAAGITDAGYNTELQKVEPIVLNRLASSQTGRNNRDLL